MCLIEFLRMISNFAHVCRFSGKIIQNLPFIVLVSIHKCTWLVVVCYALRCLVFLELQLWSLGVSRGYHHTPNYLFLYRFNVLVGVALRFVFNRLQFQLVGCLFGLLAVSFQNVFAWVLPGCKISHCDVPSPYAARFSVG